MSEDIDFSKQAQAISQINASLSTTQRLLQNQLKLQTAINTALEGEIANIGSKMGEVDSIIQSKLDLDTQIQSGTAAVGASAQASADQIAAAGTQSTTALQAQQDVLFSGATQAKDQLGSVAGAAIEGMDATYNAAYAYGGDLLKRLTVAQSKVGGAVVDQLADTTKYAGQVQEATTAAYMRFHTGMVPGMKMAMAQVFESEQAYMEYVNKIQFAASSGTRFMRDMNEEQIAEGAILANGLGLNAGQMQEFISRAMETTGKASTKLLQEAAHFSAAIEKKTGTSSKVIGGYMADMMTDTDKFGNTSVEEMARIGGALAELGMDYQKFSGMVQKFSNFETAAQSVGQLTQLHGVHLDAVELMNAANEDQFSMLEMVREGYLAAGVSADDMTQAEKRAAAAALAIDPKQFEKLIMPGANIKSMEDLKAATDEAGDVEGIEGAMAAIADDITKVTGRGEELSKLVEGKLEGALAAKLAPAAAKAAVNMNQLAIGMPIKGVEALGGAIEGLAGMTAKDMNNAVTSAKGLGEAFSNMGTVIGESGAAKNVSEMAGSMKDLGSGLADGFLSAFSQIEAAFSDMFKNMLASFQGSEVAAKSTPPFFAPTEQGMIGAMDNVAVSGGESFNKLAASGKDASLKMGKDSSDMVSSIEGDTLYFMQALGEGYAEAGIKLDEMSEAEKKVSAEASGLSLKQFEQIFDPEAVSAQIEAMEAQSSAASALSSDMNQSISEVNNLEIAPPKTDEFTSSMGIMDQFLATASGNMQKTMDTPIEMDATLEALMIANEDADSLTMSQKDLLAEYTSTNAAISQSSPQIDTDSLNESMSGAMESLGSAGSTAQSAMEEIAASAQEGMGGMEDLASPVAALEASLASLEGTDPFSTLKDDSDAFSGALSSADTSLTSLIAQMNEMPSLDSSGLVNFNTTSMALVDQASNMSAVIESTSVSMGESMASAMSQVPRLDEAMGDPELVNAQLAASMTQMSDMAAERKAEIEGVSAEIQGVEVPGKGEIQTVKMDITDNMNVAVKSLQELADKLSDAKEIQNNIDLTLALKLDGGTISTIKEKIMFSPGVSGKTITLQDE